MRKRTWLMPVVCVLICLSVVRTTWAQNNKFGIHILETTEVQTADKIVNSNGGDWGYMTVVLRQDDFDRLKWQTFMDECRTRHVIPIVRIATYMQEDGTWARPQEGELSKWPEFLDSLNWPVQQQIVTIFNEPNHAKEWGGQIDPQEYARFLSIMIQEFKSRDTKFYILNAGLDQAAGNTASTLGEEGFLRWMAVEEPDIFNKLDGWASHSYPNHGFVGSAKDTGKASISGYLWELDYLGQLGLSKDLPVFITETGWPHKEGVKTNNSFYNGDRVARLTGEAFSIWENDDVVRAVTPFVYSYPVEPFDHFSWVKENGEYYPQTESLTAISKIAGLPEQEKDYVLKQVELADILPTNYLYKGRIVVQNTGQWIMGERESFAVPMESSPSGIKIESEYLDKGKGLVNPGEEIELGFEVTTGTQSAEYKISIDGKEYIINVFKPLDLQDKKISIWRQIYIKLKLWWESASG
jgi:hypothetical protein